MRKPIEPTPYGVKTAWADPEHMRLTLPPPDERVNPPETERRRGPDPDDPWATNTYGVIPTPRERRRWPRAIHWDELFTEDDKAAIALALVTDARHLACGGWQVPLTTLFCACGQPLFRLEAVS